MRIVMTAALVLSVGLASAAWAEKGGNPNKGKGNDKDWRPGPAGPAAPGGPPGHARKFGANDNAAIQAYYGQSFRGNCPPGLAKKNNGCLPPGQAKRWAVGQPLPAGVTWYAVPQDLYVRLTPPPYGHRYVYLDGGVLLLNLSSRLVVDAVTINIAIR
jgi:Ni/Co efflux regulator RcnB